MHRNIPSKITRVVNPETKNRYSSSHCSRCKLVGYSSQLFTKNLQCKDHQQLDPTITDLPLQAVGCDKSFYGYAKQSSNEQPIECEDSPS